MKQQIAIVALVVRAYDEAIAYITCCLHFELVEDTLTTSGGTTVTYSSQRSRGRNRTARLPSSSTSTATAGIFFSPSQMKSACWVTPTGPVVSTGQLPS